MTHSKLKLKLQNLCTKITPTDDVVIRPNRLTTRTKERNAAGKLRPITAITEFRFLRNKKPSLTNQVRNW